MCSISDELGNSFPIHERIISVQTYEAGENRILVIGRLSDERLCPSFAYSIMDFIGPKVIHDIKIKMTVTLDNMTIASINAEMTTVPSKTCKEVMCKVEMLEGFKLTNGLRHKIRETMNGINGCIHIVNLLMSMISAAIQGSFTYFSRLTKDRVPRKLDLDESLVVNCCHTWKESGSHVKKLKKLKAAAVNPMDIEQVIKDLRGHE